MIAPLPEFVAPSSRVGEDMARRRGHGAEWDTRYGDSVYGRGHAALGALASCESGTPRGRGALAGIGDIITGLVGAVTGTIQGFQQAQQNDTDRYWAGQADRQYAQWLDYWTRTGEIPERACTTNREGAPWCARAWERFLMTVNAEQQVTFRTFATPEIIVAGILFVLAVRASGRP